MSNLRAEVYEQFEHLRAVNLGAVVYTLTGVAIIKTLTSLTYNEPKTSAKYKVK